ncbi:hypothetical protein F4859DRAFT_468108, partial [Xylaria cf. heliscus]
MLRCFFLFFFIFLRPAMPNGVLEECMRMVRMRCTTGSGQSTTLAIYTTLLTADDNRGEVALERCRRYIRRPVPTLRPSLPTLSTLPTLPSPLPRPGTPTPGQWISFLPIFPKRAGLFLIVPFLSISITWHPINTRFSTVLIHQRPSLFEPECDVLDALHHIRHRWKYHVRSTAYTSWSTWGCLYVYVGTFSTYCRM